MSSGIGGFFIFLGGFADARPRLAGFPPSKGNAPRLQSNGGNAQTGPPPRLRLPPGFDPKSRIHREPHRPCAQRAAYRHRFLVFPLKAPVSDGQGAGEYWLRPNCHAASCMRGAGPYRRQKVTHPLFSSACICTTTFVRTPSLFEFPAPEVHVGLTCKLPVRRIGRKYDFTDLI